MIKLLKTICWFLLFKVEEFFQLLWWIAKKIGFLLNPFLWKKSYDKLDRYEKSNLSEIFMTVFLIIGASIIVAIGMPSLFGFLYYLYLALTDFSFYFAPTPKTELFSLQYYYETGICLFTITFFGGIFLVFLYLSLYPKISDFIKDNWKKAKKKVEDGTKKFS